MAQVFPAHRNFISLRRAGRIHMRPLWRQSLIPLEILGADGLVCGGKGGAIAMMDTVMIAMGCACFALAIAYTYACDRL